MSLAALAKKAVDSVGSSAPRTGTRRLVSWARPRLRRPVDDVVSSVAHELKTPLTSIVGLLDTLGDPSIRLEDDERREMLDLTRRAAGQMAYLIDELLTKSRLERGAPEPDLQPVDLAAVVTRVLDLVPSVSPRVFVAGETTALAFADPQYVEQIVANLFQNAERYAPLSPVEVTIRADDTTVYLHCSDDGPGVPPGRRHDIFSWREASSGRNGLGLGLAVSRELAHSMGGDLRCDQPQRSGATFTLSLPRSDAGRPPQRPAFSSSTTSPMGPRARLLVEMTDALADRSIDGVTAGISHLYQVLLGAQAGLLAVPDGVGGWQRPGSFGKRATDLPHDGLLDTAAAGQEPLLIRELGDRDPGWSRLLGGSSALFLPVVDDQRPLGVLAVGWSGPADLPGEQGTAVASALARLAAIAIDRCSLAETVGFERRLRASVMEALPIAISVFAGDPPRLVDWNEQEERLLGLDGSGYRPNDLAASQERFSVRFVDGTPLTLDNAPVVQTIRTGERKGPFALRIRRIDGTEVLTRTYCAPLHDDEGVVAGAIVTSEQIEEWELPLDTPARTEHRPDPSPELVARLRQQAAAAELGQQALEGGDLDTLLQTAATVLADALGLELAKVLELRDDGTLLLRAGVGWNPGLVGTACVGSAAGSQAGYTLVSDEPVIVTDLGNDERVSGPPLLTDHGVVSGISVAIPGPHGPFGVLGAHSTRPRRFTGDDTAFLRLVANTIGSAVAHSRAQHALEAAVADQSRRLGYEQALVGCAQALLTSEDSLESALQALLAATGAAYAFVERNAVDDQGRFGSMTVLGVTAAGYPSGAEMDEYWAFVPWDRMPTLRTVLERGRPVAFNIEDLADIERALYAGSPILLRSELDLPIFVGGRWLGLIGFADTIEKSRWADEDVRVLEAAARMIGALWERNEARERLEQLVESKDELLASVSHGLRTPLSAVVGLSHELRDSCAEMDPGEAHELIALVAQQSMELAHLVDDLLVAGRPDLTGLPVSPEWVDVGEQLDAVVSGVDPHARHRIDVRAAAVRAWADPFRLRQVLRNLTVNAVAYGGDRIEIRAEVAGDCVVVTIADDGPGIAGRWPEDLFEPYERAHDRMGQPGSVGLGLTVGRRLARLMDGDLEYRRRGQWTVFTLSLPASRPVA